LPNIQFNKLNSFESAVMRLWWYSPSPGAEQIVELLYLARKRALVFRSSCSLACDVPEIGFTSGRADWDPSAEVLLEPFETVEVLERRPCGLSTGRGSNPGPGGSSGLQSD